MLVETMDMSPCFFGAAKILQANQHVLQGTAVLIFQPVKESLAGAKKMIEERALKNVEANLGIHLTNRFPIRKVAPCAGPNTGWSCNLRGCNHWERRSCYHPATYNGPCCCSFKHCPRSSTPRFT